MHRLTTPAEAFARLFGLDVFIEPAGPAWAFLDFDRVNHGEGEHEAWGLGLHIVVSPLTRA
ncbi:MAG: hypothetical protein C0505_19830 [Leptothrix sp. (in: Bacteria)]|nr:hypothetical protein [Leptothrix sp. (in: b-proteobacteria)]